MFIVEGTIDDASISGSGNCLALNPIGFEAISCFYGSIGYMCENRGEIKAFSYYLFSPQLKDSSALLCMSASIEIINLET